MRNPAESQDEDSAFDADIMRQLDAISTNAGAGPVPGDQPKVTSRAFAVRFQDPDFDDPDVTRDPIRLTRYDKAVAKHRALLAKRDALVDNAATHSREMLILQSALENSERAVRWSQGDLARKYDNHDAYRATPEGKADHNAKRRKRAQPNADVKSMAADEAALHEANKTWERQTRRRLAAKGYSEAEVQAKLIAAFAALLKKRAKKAQSTAEADAMTRQPTFGMF